MENHGIYGIQARILKIQDGTNVILGEIQDIEFKIPKQNSENSWHN